MSLQCPEEGDFIGWKKVKDKIIKLRIPTSAKRSSATSRKCRCSHAEVLGIYDKQKNMLEEKEIFNHNYCGLRYVVGYTVYADKWDEDRWVECSHGIHFFITFEEAKNY